MEEEVKVKNEPTEDDYTYEYEGAPSPEAPIYELMPLQNIPPSELAGPDVKSKQGTFKKVKSLGENNFFFNVEELERHYAFFRKLMADCQDDVPSTSSFASDIRTGNLFQDKATQCADGYVTSNLKSVKDASTETCSEFEGFYYKNYMDMCTCNKPVECLSEVGATAEDVQTHEFSSSQDAPKEDQQLTLPDQKLL